MIALRAKSATATHRDAAICECGQHGFVGLTMGFVTLFSPGSIGAVSGRKWSTWVCSGRAYAARKEAGVTLLLHRLLTAAPSGLVVDHINRETLDNREENLRVCTQSQNLMNSAPKSKELPKGVARTRQGYMARIMANGKAYYLGTFSEVQHAEIAYEAASRVLHGQFRANSSKFLRGRE